jgi:hypothetical protein
MFKKGEEAIAGFFEDIPVLLVVTLATGLFLVSIVSAYVAYLDQFEDERMHDNAMELSESIRSYEGLTTGFKEGVFMGDKLNSMDTKLLSEDFNETVLGYHFQVVIIDCSDYLTSSEYTTYFGNSNPPLKGNRYTVTTSVLIKVDYEYHPGQLIVTIWS